MRKTRKYKGGDYSTNSQPYSSSSTNGNGIFNFFSNAWNDTKKNTQGLFDSLIGKSPTTNTSSSLSTNTTFNNNSLNSSYPISSSTSVTPVNINRPSYGGKKSKRIKGGKPAPVYNLSVAKPTYWIKGGKTKKKRNKRKRSKH